MRRSLAVVLLLAAVSAVWLHPAGNQPLAQQVTIRRDTWGIPHILGETEEAAAFGMGYAQAEDHAAEIARRFLRARGEEAGYTGAGVENDFRMKRYRNHAVAQSGFAQLDPLFQRLLHAYAAGFNLYVEKHRTDLPAWIPAFDGVDVLAHGRAEVHRFAFPEASIRALQRKYPELPSSAKPAPPSGPAGDELEGSNMWAIHGSRTVSGRTILLGNPHQPWAALYYEAQITVPGKINFYGTTFIGRPVLTTGFNERLAWTHTVNLPDLADIYTLTADPQRPESYLFEGQSRELIRHEVAVEIHDRGKLRTERRTYWDSHLGPIVHRAGNKLFALKTSFAEAFRYYEEWYALSKSRNWKEFTANLRRNQIPMFNLVYADADGNIAYVWNGMVPKRVEGPDYRLDVPGETGRYVWTGLHTLDELPQLFNPAGGYVQNCNDPPWWTTLRQPLDPAKFPSYFEPGRTLGLRTQVSLEMLEGQEKFTLEDVIRLKFNNKMLLADRVRPDLLKALRAAPNPSVSLKRAGAALEAWDGRVDAASRGGVLFQRFWETYRTATQQPFAVPWDAANPNTTPRGIAVPALALRHLEEAAAWTRKTYGAEDVAWGDVHRLRLGNLDLPAGGAGGEYGLFRVMNYAPAPDGKRVIGVPDAKQGQLAGGGDGAIFAVEFTRPLRAFSILAYGQTRNPASKHSADQAPLFARQELKRVAFTENEIRANLARSYRPGQEP